MPAPGRPARRGLDRERPPPLPVARLRLRPAHRSATGGLQRRAGGASGRGARGRRVGGAPQATPHQRTVGDVVAETLCEWGVDTVFGMVGHSNLGFADALRRLEQADHLQYIGIRHEGAAAFAASAYGKLTGRPAACLGIAGPGSTNLLTGLYDAKVDRAPVVAVLGAGAVEGAGARRLPGPRSQRRVRRCRGVVHCRAGRVRPRRAGLARGEARPRCPLGRPPGPARRGAGPADRAAGRDPAGPALVVARVARRRGAGAGPCARRGIGRDQR